jgi:hypothetical protein
MAYQTFKVIGDEYLQDLTSAVGFCPQSGPATGSDLFLVCILLANLVYTWLADLASVEADKQTNLTRSIDSGLPMTPSADKVVNW